MSYRTGDVDRDCSREVENRDEGPRGDADGLAIFGGDTKGLMDRIGSFPGV